MLKIAILDDYAGVALQCADWSRLPAGAQITVFDRHLGEDEAATVLAPFDVLCTIRERMALPRSLLARLPKLKLVTIVGMTLANLDMAAATDHGIVIVHSDAARPEFARVVNAAPELAWGLMLATVRHIAREDAHMRAGAWQSSMGVLLAGRTLGLLGLGRIGQRMARYGQAFDMQMIAWSQNLTAETAAAAGVRRVEKDELFGGADILSIHLQLSERTRGLVGARELGLMKPEAYLVNTSRGPIVQEAALVVALREGRLAGAGLDVFDQEPLPADHPLRSLENVTLTPHLGYVTIETLRAFYGGMPEAIAAFATGAPVRVANPAVLQR
jgi:phosphoglycerate dehydrogenase-like enzyme